MTTDKSFILSDSSVNCYGYRLLTSGYQIGEFKKNPIGYYMHGTPEFPRESGVLVRWEDVKIVGDTVIGTPVINKTHPRGNKTIDEVNNGFLNGASVGHIVVLESSDDPSLKLPGQTGVTITKWFNREASLVDVPGNYQATALGALYNSDGKLLNLADFGVGRNDSTVSIAHAKLLTESEVVNILSNNIKAHNITQETAIELRKHYIGKPKGELEELMSYFSSLRLQHLVTLTYDELDKQGLLEELKERSGFEFREKFFDAFGKEFGQGNANSSKKRVLTIDDVIAYGKRRRLFDEGSEEGLRASWKDDPEALLQKFKEQTKKDHDNLLKKKWDDLDKQGLLETLKKENYQVFAEKFKEKFGIEFKHQAALIS